MRSVIRIAAIVLLLLATNASAFLPRGGSSTPGSTNDPMTTFLATLSPGHWVQIGPAGGNLGASPTTPHTNFHYDCYFNNGSLTPIPPDYNTATATTIAGSTTCGAAQLDVWSGADFDSVDDLVFVASGGHMAWCGSDMYAFDISNLVWIRYTTPINFSAQFSYSGCSGGSPEAPHIFPNGDAYAIHNYGANGYLPNAGTHGRLTYECTTGLPYSIGNPASTTVCPQWDVATGTAFSLCNYTDPNNQVVKAPCAATTLGSPASGWIDVTTNPPRCVSATDMGGLTDPTLGGSGQQWIQYNSQCGGWQVYDVATNSWSYNVSLTPTNPSDNCNGEFWDHGVAVLRTAGGVHQLWLVNRGAAPCSFAMTLLEIDMASKTYTSWNNSSYSVPNSYYPGVLYDSKRDKIIALSDGVYSAQCPPSSGNFCGLPPDSITIIDPTQNPPGVSLHTTTGGGSNMIGTGAYGTILDGIMTRFLYDPKHDVYLLFINDQADVWVYKPDF